MGIGYGDGDDNTILDNMQNNYWSIYLRIEFEVPDFLADAFWTLRVRYERGSSRPRHGDSMQRVIDRHNQPSEDTGRQDAVQSRAQSR